MPILCDVVDAVATVTIDAPESLNAVSIDELVGLRAAFIECQQRADVRVVILTGAGSRAFCTGSNLKATPAASATFAQQYYAHPEADPAAGGVIRLGDLTVLNLWKPVIAAVNGYCLGGGLEIALQCDLRIASSNASFGLPEVKIASVPAAGGVQNLLKAIPAAYAMKMALTGDRIDAALALHLGLVSDVVAPELLMQTAHEIALRIAANGPLAVQAVKRLALGTTHLHPQEIMHQSNLQWALLKDSADRVEGRVAFAEKRAPVFKGQ